MSPLAEELNRLVNILDDLRNLEQRCLHEFLPSDADECRKLGRLVSAMIRDCLEELCSAPAAAE